LAAHVVFQLFLIVAGAVALFVFAGSRLDTDADTVAPAAERRAVTVLFGSWFVAGALLLGLLAFRRPPLWSGLVVTAWCVIAVGSFAVIFTAGEANDPIGHGLIVVRLVDAANPSAPDAIVAPGFCI
jgi:quinol-cytochrome oxidoreductase complex cytochrome b subunit